MRIIINIDPIRNGKKRMRIRTKYQLSDKDERLHISVGNAMVDFYHQITDMIRDGIDEEISEYVDEGEKI